MAKKDKVNIPIEIKIERTTEEKIKRLQDLVQEFYGGSGYIRIRELQIEAEKVAQQKRYDEYFDLFKELDPEDAPKGMHPSLIPPLLSQSE
jgi:hypothetical protein